MELGLFARLSSTRHHSPNTDQLLTYYSFITRSLALSLALREKFADLNFCWIFPFMIIPA
jgi:hypothetical protein